MDADQDIVKPTMIVALEFHDPTSPCVGAGQANCCLDNFGPGTTESYKFGTGEDLAQPLGECDLPLVLSGEELTNVQSLVNRRNDIRWTMTQEHRTLAEQVVNVYVAINVDQSAAMAARKEYGPGFHGHADVTANSTGQGFLGSLKHAARSLPPAEIK
jgi:hypothetical protein